VTDATSASDDRPVLTIDLAAITDNWRHLAAMARPAQAAAAVKADAYGLGVAKVAPALAAAGCRAFFVATLEEGIELRALLGSAEIYVLNGVAPGGVALGGAAAMLRHALRPCLFALDQIALWQRLGRGQPAALHIDSGINRLGLDSGEVELLAREPGRLAGIEIALIMSHLACADDARHPLNRRQLAAFIEAVASLGLGGRPLSFASSSGIFLGPEFHLAMVRPGAALYGLSPFIDRPNPMRQVITLTGKILQVRRVDRGMTVGYGATHPIGQPGRIAVVGLGYADGYRRALGNRGHAFLGGLSVPVVGRVSMDMITLDVSATPPELAVPGAPVELIGPHHSIDALAAEAGTNGYELMTGLGRRFARVYLGADAAAGSGPRR
jgi:alanine racemase